VPVIADVGRGQNNDANIIDGSMFYDPKRHLCG